MMLKNHFTRQNTVGIKGQKYANKLKSMEADNRLKCY